MHTQSILRTRRLGAAAVMLLASCSSGSDETGPDLSALQVNRAPNITSPASVTVNENLSGPAYTILASDPEGEPISYAISGPDAARFTLDTEAGTLTFIMPPDFEAPADTDSSNDYLIDVSVTDAAGNTAARSVTITVADINESLQRYIDPIFSAINVQTGIEFAPGLFLDIYMPAGDTATDRPVMIAASGGGFVVQDRTNVEPIARAFAQRGYVAATMDYRVLAAQPMTADELAIAGVRATHDMFAAVRFFRADALSGNLYGTRSDAIFVSGESAGGVMAAIAATIDASDTILSQAVRDDLAANGGVYGMIGSNGSVSSLVQGAMPLSGAVLELQTVDAQSSPLYAAHEEFDPIVPCDTAPESSSFTGLVVSGACDLVPTYQAASATAVLYLVGGAVGHVDFSNAQREEIYAGAANLFFETVISP
ncbi:MAG: carboxylesterase family protein [Pseudomonadota bacterium]